VWVREGLSLTQGRGQDEHIEEVLQEIAAEVCINLYKEVMMFVIRWKAEDVVCRVCD
jgi:hypothetical protein